MVEKKLIINGREVVANVTEGFLKDIEKDN
jgi:hypothetical protein